MKVKTLAAVAVPVAATLSLAGCASATSACVVRHGYAIVIFQNGMANYSKRFVRHFRLEIKYGPNEVVRRVVNSRIVLKTAQQGNPPVVVRTYPVGRAIGCRVDKVAAHT